MRISLLILVLASLSACSVVPTTAWTFDPTQPSPRTTLSVAESSALTDRVAQLQLERNEIRSRIANEPDAWKRQGYYQQLHQVGRQLSPLERRLSTVASAR